MKFLLAACLPFGFVHSGVAATLYRDQMTDANAWGINRGPDPDSTALFGYDYSADGIPEAPHTLAGDTPTAGVKLEANQGDLTAEAALFTLYPLGQNFTGSYQLRFDAWQNFDARERQGSALGTTEYLGGGIGYDNVTADVASGAQAIATGDGGTSIDWQAFKSPPQFGVPFSDMSGGTYNGNFAYYSNFFPPLAPPAVQGQTALGRSGSPGFQWITWEFSVMSNLVTINVEKPSGERLEIVRYDKTDRTDGSAGVTTDGNVSIFYGDLFPSISSRPDLTFAVVDNVEVTSLPEPPYAWYDSATGDVSVQLHADTQTLGITASGQFNTSGPAPLIGSIAPLERTVDELTYRDDAGLPRGNWPLPGVLPAGLGFGDVQFNYTLGGVATSSAPLGVASPDIVATPAARYDSATGELFVQLPPNIGVAGFSTPNSDFLPAFSPRSLGNSPAAQFTATHLAYFDASGLPAGEWPLGAVLPAGLREGSIGFAYTRIGEETVQQTVEFLNVDPRDPHSRVTAFYQPSTGELLVQIEGSIGVFGFETQGLFNTSITPQDIGGPAAQFDPSILAYFNANGLPNGFFLLGPVLPPGLPASEILFAYSGPGQAPVTSEVIVLDVVIPEPDTWALWMLGSVVLRAIFKRQDRFA
jgi:hypothetical protein